MEAFIGCTNYLIGELIGMLLEYSAGTMYLNQAAPPSESQFILTLLSDGSYSLGELSDQRSTDSQYLLVDPLNKTVVINTSWYGESPLFYLLMENYILITDSFEDFYSKSALHQIDLELDRIALLESMIFDNVLRERTFFKNIKKIVPGRQIHIDIIKEQESYERKFVLPFNSSTIPGNSKVLLDEATDILRGLLDAVSLDDQRLLLPLSAGLDSRLLACLLQDKGLKFESIVFGPRESIEPFVAKRVAALLGINLAHLELKDAYYLDYGRRVTYRTGGLSCHRHCHLYACLANLDLQYDTIVHGYMGDVYSGGAQSDVATNYAISESEAIQKFLKVHVERVRIWKLLTDEERFAITTDLQAVMDESNTVNLPCHFDEYIHNVDRQFGLTANIFAPINQFGTVLRPFANYEYATFFNSLPASLRSDRLLFRNACKILFPEPFNIGNQDQFFAKASMLGRLESMAFNVYKVVAYASMVASQGRFVLRNPKSIERHRELLTGTLQHPFKESIRAMSAILDRDLSFLSGVHFGNRRELDSQFRILSAHTLIMELQGSLHV